MKTTKTTAGDTITYTAIIDGVEASELIITADTRIVANVETLTDYRRQGLAAALWEVANADGEVFHALEHHRTDEGQAFADAMGGETIDDETGFIAECWICTGDHDDD